MQSQVCLPLVQYREQSDNRRRVFCGCLTALTAGLHPNVTGIRSSNSLSLLCPVAPTGAFTKGTQAYLTVRNIILNVIDSILLNENILK